MSNGGENGLKRLSREKPLSIAILAMGGQGGGVLADWIVEVAESQGWVAQSTSVPGVAQRTGATIYYIETLPPRDGVPPVLSLMPTPGDVDVVMAAELMEAGRSVLRGLVTPDRTTLIASTHRAYAVAEKERPGDGTGDPVVVADATDFAARRVIAFDMEQLAVKNGSMISAAMLGALAASDALPFARSAYETVVGAGAKGASASLKAFAAAYDRTRSAPREAPRPPTPKRLDALPSHAGHPELDRLVARIRGEFPAEAQSLLFAGVKRAVDFQDVAYANEYLDRVGSLAALDRAHGGQDRHFALTCEAAKYVAVAMAYDDVIRVADIKVRASRFARLRNEIGAKPDQIVHSTEYLHPRAEEVCGALPAGLGAFIEARPALYGALDRFVNRGRRIDVRRLGGFLQLYLVSGLRTMRRGNLRHGREVAHREAWLARAIEVLPKNYDLAVEVLRCRRLVKGYSDTHSRGLSKFDRVMAMVPKLAGRDDGAQWLERLKRAALMDEAGTALDGAIKTVETL
ncbi:MAG: indolepyruvate oxidoreductase subunit beta family protein [Xanthobacteraceae bacterium]|nr:indolepyruvate oxidoreductase subunit beta family protein [Xanthobacteraceae bacterium]